jgi:phage terminase large subunit-like protein
MSNSALHKLKSLSKDERKKFLKSLTESEQRVLFESSRFLLRPEQKVPKEVLEGKKRNWLIMSGRGWGKNFSATHNLFTLIRDYGYKNIIYVGRTKEDVRDIIIDGPSGLASNCPSDFRMVYSGHTNRVIFPEYNAVVRLRSGESPDSLRGPNTDLVIFDELASYQYPQETWDNGQFGLRLNSMEDYPPICIITTTPRPIDLIRNIVADDNTYITTGSTFDNPDLSSSFLTYLKEKYEGTTLGRQELSGEILNNIEGALWNLEMVKYGHDDVYERIVIAVDPAVTSKATSDETGIIVAGLSNEMYYILDDRSGRYTTNGWAEMVDYLYHFYEADKVIAEVNQGGDMVESTLRSVNKTIPYKAVRAYKGKYLRAEPISALYEQNKVCHVKRFPKLEDELTTYVPGITRQSPNRLDAMVYALTELQHRIIAPPGMKVATTV